MERLRSQGTYVGGKFETSREAWYVKIRTWEKDYFLIDEALLCVLVHTGLIFR